MTARDTSSETQDTAPATRRTGRPRAGGRAVEGDPTEEILSEAGRLFNTHGIQATTMASIAEASGLKQSSLYYYFTSREQIVAALVERANVVPLELAQSLSKADASPAARLFRFVQGDVTALCHLQLDIGETHRIASRDRERFAEYWKERRRLERLLADLVQAGIDAGQFRPTDPKLTALLIMGNDEGVQNWFRSGPRRSVQQVSDAMARLTIGGLLLPESSVEDVAAEAAELAGSPEFR